MNLQYNNFYIFLKITREKRIKKRGWKLQFTKEIKMFGRENCKTISYLNSSGLRTVKVENQIMDNEVDNTQSQTISTRKIVYNNTSD